MVASADTRSSEESPRTGAVPIRAPGELARGALIAALERVSDIRAMQVGAVVAAFGDIERAAEDAAKRTGRRVEQLLRELADTYVREARARKRGIKAAWWAEWVAAQLADVGGGVEGDIDEHGNPVFPEIDGESTADRRRRLEAWNRRIMEGG